MYKIPVVVIRSNDHCFLDILRSCGTEGIPVIPVVFSWEGAGEWFSEKSKYYAKPVVVRNPAEDAAKTKQELLTLGKKLYEKYKSKLLIIPSSDTSLIFLQENFEEFKKYFYQMGHDDFEDSCIRELSKAGFAELMEENGIKIPKTYSVEKAEDIEKVAKITTYPCIYKPSLKDVGNTFQRLHKQSKAIECKDSEVLKENLKQELQNGYKLIVQEKIKFDRLEDEISIYAYSDKAGNVTMLSGLHKVVEYPKPYGTGVVCKQYVKKELIPMAKRVMQALRWHGFVCIEFMKDSQTNEWVVIEVNLRPWLSIYFQGFLGFNYVAQLYKEIYCEKTESETNEELVISCNNNFLMLDIAQFIKEEITKTKNLEKALIEVISFIRTNLGKCIFSYYLLGDEGPGIAEKKMILKQYGASSYIEELYSIMMLNNIELRNQVEKLNLSCPNIEN